jgi:hypothetical protein
MTDDPANVADALTSAIGVIAGAMPYDGEYGSPEQSRKDAEVILEELAAAGYEVVPAGTAARLLRDHADTTNRITEVEASALERIAVYRERTHAAEARLSALTDAIGDPDELLLWVHEYNSIKLRQVCERIAAAVQPPDSTPPPSVCPTCGSDDTEMDGFEWRLNNPGGGFCPNPWHQQ